MHPWVLRGLFGQNGSICLNPQALHGSSAREFVLNLWRKVNADSHERFLEQLKWQVLPCRGNAVSHALFWTAGSCGFPGVENRDAETGKIRSENRIDRSVSIHASSSSLRLPCH